MRSNIYEICRCFSPKLKFIFIITHKYKKPLNQRSTSSSATANNDNDDDEIFQKKFKRVLMFLKTHIK